MDKDKKLTGQPVLSEILDLISSSLITKVSRKYKANRYYKKLALTRTSGKPVVKWFQLL